MGGKLLFVASTRSHIEHFHLPYLKAFCEKGWSVHCAFSGTVEAIPFTDQTILLPFEKKMTSPRNFRVALILRKLIRTQRYDVVAVHTSLAAFFTRLAVLGMKEHPQVINIVHGYLFDDSTSPLKRTLLLAAERITAPVTDLLLTMNQYDREISVKYRLGKRMASIPGIGVDFSRLDRQRSGNPAKLRQNLGISSDAFLLIYPAEFSARKSQHILLQAMKMLPDKAVLVLPGTGTLLKDCKVLTQKLGIEDRVIFPGYVKEMGLWYEMADCAVSASRSEGLPFNIMEAMYYGLPVVASAVKGHTDLICHGSSGLLYPCGDWKACAEQIQRIMKDKSYAFQLAHTGRENVAQYELSHVFPQVMKQYQIFIS